MVRPCRLLVLLMLGLASATFAQDAGHRHPPSDNKLHDTFYSTWKKPRSLQSCCNKQDCYPTQAYFRQDTGTWFAFIRETQRFEQIPLAVYDQKNPPNETTPDDRAHVCATPDTTNAGRASTIHCFVPPPPDV